jgi:hypothetical protein
VPTRVTCHATASELSGLLMLKTSPLKGIVTFKNASIGKLDASIFYGDL